MFSPLDAIGSNYNSTSHCLMLKFIHFRVVSAGRQLARSLEMQSLNDLGFSKRHMRCLQVVNTLTLKWEGEFSSSFP